MTAKRAPEPKEAILIARQATILERFDSVLFPFDVLALIDALPSAGWIVSETLEENEDVRRLRVPVKGNNRLRVDQSAMTLGVNGKSPEDALAAFREIRALAREVSPLSLQVDTYYVEFRFIGRLVSNLSAVDTFASFWTANDNVVQLGQALSESLPSDNGLLPYGMRFATQAPDANRPNWAELNITPVTNQDKAGFQFDLIYRHEDHRIVETVIEHADAFIRDFVARIEGVRDGNRRRT